MENYNNDNDIAVIGMSGAFPGADNIDEFWQNLISGKCSITDVKEQELINAGVPREVYERDDYIKKTASLKDISQFDAEFFNYPPAEARLLDPQQRLFLEHCWAAIESAGYIPDQVDGSVGVYAGCGLNRYLLEYIDINIAEFGLDDFQKMLASEKDYLTTRVSYKLNLKGPSLDIQTACSTSLVATQLGVLSLQTYQCDMALCGGVALNIPHGLGYIFDDGMINSSDGYCSPFSEKASGTIFGDGVGVVLLKRLGDALDDKDPILAVIKGAACNNDGKNKVGFTAPSAEGQAEVISLAQHLAEVDSSQIRFVETHGTATKIGDAIELAALHDVFKNGENNKPYCALGTLKANIGHLDTAAGIASLIKTILILKNRVIPPNCVHDNSYPEIQDANTPFYFNRKPIDLINEKEIFAGVSSFGIGGTNAHIVLASPPPSSQLSPENSDSNALLFFCAKSSDSAKMQQQTFTNYLNDNPQVANNAAYTLFRARKHFDERTFSLVTKDLNGKTKIDEFTDCFSAKKQSRVAFLFPGQGSQYKGMTFDLYNENRIFKHYFDQCVKKLIPITGKDFKDIVFSQDKEPDALNYTINVQLSLFLVEYSLAKTFMDFGVSPSVMMGHSIGEYAAACLAGVFNLDDALWIVFRRGQLMNETPSGAMLVVFTSRSEIEELLKNSLAISIENSPENVVVSGLEEDIQGLKKQLTEKNISNTLLPNRHAFHSAFMEPILEEFSQVFKNITLNKPKIEIITATPGFSSDDLNKPDYWTQQLRREVGFYSAIKDNLLQKDVDITLELGPGSALSSFIWSSVPETKVNMVTTVPNKRNSTGSKQVFIKALANLWCSGVDIDLTEAGLINEGNRVGLPTYQFSKQRFWMKPKPLSKADNYNDHGPIPDLESISRVVKNRDRFDTARDDLDMSLMAVWKKTLGIDHITIDDNFFELGGDSLLALKTVKSMYKATGISFSHSLLFESPTIRSLVDQVGDQVENAASTVKLNDCTDGIPMFCLCGVMIYKPLAELLGHTNPVYGIYTEQEIKIIEGVNNHQPLSVRMDNLIDIYVDAVKRHVNGKKLILAGLSFGGFMALEITKRLKPMGFDVTHVILFDSYLPRESRWSIKKIVLDIANRNNKYNISWVRRKLADKFKNRLNFQRKRINGVYPNQNDILEVDRNIAFHNIAGSYDCSGKRFDFDVLLIKALEAENGFGKVGRKDNGMNKIVFGHLKVKNVKGDHTGILKGKPLYNVYSAVSEYLQVGQK